MANYKLKTPKIIDNTVVKGYKKIETSFVDNFLEKDEESESGYHLKAGKVGKKVVSAYKKIEDKTVNAYKKIEDKFVDTFLEKQEEDK